MAAKFVSQAFFTCLMTGTCLCLASCAPQSGGNARNSEQSSRAAEEVPLPDTSKSSTAAATKEAVELKSVKYDELVAAVKAQKGKIVIIDVWASYCIPCKKEFPHLVQLHKDFAKDGLVCMSVTVDDMENKGAALKFLQAQQATFANYFLDEEVSLWQEKWDITGIPAVFVFDREGKRAAKFDNDSKQFTYEDVRKVVVKLLGS